MNIRRVFSFLLAVLVTVGLTVAPLAVPAAAGQLMTANMQTADADMPCCPGQQDQKAKDCGSCPIVALCMFNLVLLTPEAASLVDLQFSRNAFATPDDPLIDGLGACPPDHPPRMAV